MTTLSNFKFGNDSPSIARGTYYVLIPKQDHSPYFETGKPVFLPVIDTVSWSFSHEWNEADNYAKGVINTLMRSGGTTTDLASRVALRAIGGAPHVSACAVYMDSAPPTISVRSKMFSVDGEGGLLNLIERFRADTHAGKADGGQLNSVLSKSPESVRSGFQNASNLVQQAENSVNGFAGSGAVKASLYVDHPDWWDVQVVTFAGGGAKKLASMKDMVCTGMNVTFFAPFYKSEPSMIEIDLQFKHGFRGLRESMTFGG